jgi:hypothetical protein
MLGPGVEAYRPWTRRTLPRCPFYKTLIKCGMQMNSVCVYFTMRDRASGMGKKRGGKVFCPIRRKSGTSSEIIILIIKKRKLWIGPPLIARIKSQQNIILHDINKL